MDNIFIFSGFISFLFVLFKIIEMKCIESENKKPLKYLIRDALLVYFSVVIGNFIVEQVSPSVSAIMPIIAEQPAIFTTEPDW
jgi:hypothetical protein